MSEEVHMVVAKKMEEAGPSVAVAMEIKIDQYFDVVRGLIGDFAAKKGLMTVYITSSVPSSTLMGALQALEVNVHDLKFVDCVSHSLMSGIGADANTAYIESPAMLENITLKVEYFSRISEGKKMLVVIDSFNSLILHNDLKMVSEFLSILLNQLKLKEAYPVILTLPEQLKPEAKEMLGMVCDSIIPLG